MIDPILNKRLIPAIGYANHSIHRSKS